MTLYLLNTLITPINFDTVRTAVIASYRLSLEEARERVRKALECDELQSAVGHEGTAQVLSRLLGVEIKTERKTVFMKKGDSALQFFLKTRLPEGKVLSAEELQTLPYWLVWSEVREVEVEKND
jgi:hypothetical protein